MGTQCPGVKLSHPDPEGYKYGNLALQVGEVSDETVKYGREFCNYTVKYRLFLSSERALQSNKHAAVSRKFQGERQFGHRSQMGA
jgi:hypothetical protein